MLTKQALWDTHNWLWPPDSLQWASTLGINTQLLCICFLHAGGGHFSHQSPVGLHVFSAALYHQELSDAFPILLGSVAGAGSKKLGHLRNHREEGPVVNSQQNKTQTSLAVSGHRQPLHGSSVWKLRGHKIRWHLQLRHWTPDLQGTQKWSTSTAYLAPCVWWCHVLYHLKHAKQPVSHKPTQSIGVRKILEREWGMAWFFW